MNLIPYETRSLMNKFHNDFNRMFADLNRATDETASSAWAPAIDVKEEASRFVVRADLPGIDPKDIEITMDHGALTISGKRQSEKKEEKDGYLRTERISGEFFRRLVLPDTADSQHVAAKADKGVLEIAIPKREAAKAKRIEIQS